MTPSPDLDVAITAARAAAAIHQAERGTDLAISSKSTPIDLVTRVDTASETTIREILLGAFPSDAILGEEEGASPGSTGRRWLVDPLDGTLNYAHGFPWYCVSIALEVDGRLQLGVVLDSAHDELFVAERGKGAWHQGRPMGVSGTTRLDQAMLATGFAYHADWMAENVKTFARMMPMARAIRRPGAAALDLATLAAGHLDGFWEIHLNPWDLAAGIVLIEEAGGQVSGPTGEPYTLGDKTFLASNGRFHESLVEALELG
jgi:myo-inositol-1(or 4)-monophosphatase